MGNETVMTDDKEIRVQQGIALRLTAWTLLLTLVYGTFAFPLMLGPIFLEMVTGELEPDAFVLFAVPSFTVFLACLTLYLATTIRRKTKPDIFSSGYFEIMGTAYRWDSVSCLYLNATLNYMVLLFRNLEGPGEWAGFSIPKKNIEPSLDAFLDLVSKQNVRIEKSKVLTVAQLWTIREERLSATRNSSETPES